MDEGELEVTDNGTIVETDNEDMYIQGKLNVTSSTTYWWGRIINLSYSNANKLRNSLKANQSRTTVEYFIISAAAIFSKPAQALSLADFALNSYISNFRSNIKTYNKVGKGIKYKIYWYGKYIMRTQGQSW